MRLVEKPGLVAGRRSGEQAPALSHAVDQLRGLLWTTDAAGRITTLLGTDAVAFGFDLEEAIGQSLFDLLPPDDAEPALTTAYQHALRGEPIQTHHRAGDHLYDVQITPVRDTSGMVTGTVALAVDITEHERIEANLAGQRQILEMLAAGASLEQVLSQLCLHLEAMIAGARCTILLLDEDGYRLRHGAAPSLLPSFAAAVDGIEIGPAVGSCGTAAYRRESVVVEEIAIDPLWIGYRELALAHGLQASWSVPIRDIDQDAILGTFAVYYGAPRRPDPSDVAIVEEAVHLASVAIRGKRAETALRQSEHRLQELASSAERQARPGN